MMTAHAEEPVVPVPHTIPHHAKKPSAEEVFEHRWRKAYEVRALERESRQAKSQVSSRCSSADSQRAAHAAPCALGKPHTSVAATVNAAAGQGAANGAVEPISCLAGKANGSETAPAAAPAAAAPPLAGEEKVVRQQEVIDDEKAASDATTGAAGMALPAQQATGWRAADRQMESGGNGKDEEEEDEGLACTVVWDSSKVRGGGALLAPDADADAAAFGDAGASIIQLKEQGNVCLRAADFEGAVRCYSQALDVCKQPGPAVEQPGTQVGQQEHQEAAGGQGKGSGHQLMATLHSNRAHALMRLKRSEEAAADALKAHRLHPTWPKPLYRLAQAKLARRQWSAAVAACRQGHSLATKNSEGHTEFTPLLDRIAVAAAKAGSLVGYDGVQLEVRHAGKDAWLGKAAPHVPELDGPEDEDSFAVTTHLPLLPSTSASSNGNASSIGSGMALKSGPLVESSRAGSAAGGGDALVAWRFSQPGEAGKRRRTSFRSVREAVEAAQDGDRILLRCGQHNGLGECITVTKRLLIEGEGQLGEAVLDQRSNVPAFRIVRGGVVLRNLDIDFTGFREALLVEGPPAAHPSPLIVGCRIKCSGDDAVNIGDAAAPTFLCCELSGKKCGLKAYGSSTPRLEHCDINKCGEQGVRVMEAAAVVMQGCTISECAEEAIVAMDATRLSLSACKLRDCKGPGVDLSGGAQATIARGSVEQCVGGVWLWDSSQATLKGATVAGGPSHAILADGAASLEVRETTVRGTVHASDAAWAGILHASNRLLDPDQPTDFPPEEGPFRFVPSPYTRKQ